MNSKSANGITLRLKTMNNFHKSEMMTYPSILIATLKVQKSTIWELKKYSKFHNLFWMVRLRGFIQCASRNVAIRSKRFLSITKNLKILQNRTVIEKVLKPGVNSINTPSRMPEKITNMRHSVQPAISQRKKGRVSIEAVDTAEWSQSALMQCYTASSERLLDLHNVIASGPLHRQRLRSIKPS